MNKAKEITKQRLRYDREPLFQELDIQFQRAIEAQTDTSAIVAEKQRLRDITKLVDQATSLDELKNLKVK
jgi:Fic family protein